MSMSTATAQWDGTIQTGTGTMTPAHAPGIPFSRGTRFEDQPGSNPEELVGAALAGCFSMALASNLGKAGASPKQIRTSASVKLEKDAAGFAITHIALVTEADVTGVDAGKFQEIADATKKGCPVSRALAGVGSITLDAKLISG